MTVRLERYRIRFSQQNKNWSVFKHQRGKGFIKDAQVAYALSKENTYPPTTNNVIESRAIVGFDSATGCMDWLREVLQIELLTGSELLYENGVYVYEKGGAIQYTDVNYYQKDGRIFNLIPKRIEHGKA